MERFDEKTGNLNKYIIKGSEMSFISISNEISDSKPDDSLIYYEDNENNSLSKYKIQIKNALKDPTNTKIRKLCIKCKKNTMVVTLKLGDDILNICSKCENKWTEGSN